MLLDVLHRDEDASADEEALVIDDAPVRRDFAFRLAIARREQEVRARLVEGDVERQIFVCLAAILAYVGHDTVSAENGNF